MQSALLYRLDFSCWWSHHVVNKKVFMVSENQRGSDHIFFFFCFYSFSRLLWHIFPFTVYFFKAAQTQPSKLITHPSKPNISIKTYNLCSIENVCFLIYLTMDNKIQTTAININLWIHHLNFCATPSQYWLFYQWQHTTLGFCTEHSYLGNILTHVLTIFRIERAVSVGCY